MKLAALILSEIPNCSVEVYEQENSIRKLISVKYPAAFKNEVGKLEKDFINRDRLRGK